jgi:translation elongation factor EF-Ts
MERQDGPRRGRGSSSPIALGRSSAAAIVEVRAETDFTAKNEKFDAR